MSSAGFNVGFIGLGAMGNAIAHNILKKSLSLVVWNRAASKANSLVNAGAQLAQTPREAVANADVMFSCLFDDQSCLQVAQDDDGYLRSIRKGTIHINLTTITPQTAQQLTELHQERGAFYIAGPVLGRPDVAAAGQLRSFLGGKLDAIERVRPIIQTYSAGSILVVGEDPAQANVIKLVANMILSSTVSLFGQSYALSERWNIDSSITQQVHKIFYSHPSLLAYEERIRTRNYQRSHGEGFSVEGGLKDINAMIDAGKQVDVTLPFCDVTKQQCLSAMERGLNEMDWSVLGDIARVDTESIRNYQSKKS